MRGGRAGPGGALTPPHTLIESPAALAEVRGHVAVGMMKETPIPVLESEHTERSRDGQSYKHSAQNIPETVHSTWSILETVHSTRRIPETVHSTRSIPETVHSTWSILDRTFDVERFKASVLEAEN